MLPAVRGLVRRRRRTIPVTGRLTTSATRPSAGGPIRLGLRANGAQFSLLVAVNALVGGMLGQERTVLPLLAERVFHLAAYTAALTFIVAFGAVKAATNFFAGTLSDRYGRKPVLVAGWLIGRPVPLLLIWAPSWGWVIVANVLLGVNQGLTWSTTVIMKIDLVGPRRRGLAMGFNEAAGYGAVAATALATGYIAAQYGLRPAPFFLGIAYVALGLGLSALFVRETHRHARTKPPTTIDAAGDLRPGRSSPGPRSPITRSRRPRPGWSTTSTTASPGGCSRSVRGGRAVGGPHRRARRALPGRVGARPARHRRPVRPHRPQAAHRRRHAHPGRRHRAIGATTGFWPGRRSPCSSGPAPPWSTPRCSPRSATSPTRPGGLGPSASTGSGATAASPSAPSSPASSPTCGDQRRDLDRRRTHRAPGSSSPSACTRPTHEVTGCRCPTTSTSRATHRDERRTPARSCAP